MIIEKANSIPKNIKIPQISINPPAKWWENIDDQQLLYSIWKNGFTDYKSIKFSHDSSIEAAVLANRVNSILCAYIKETFDTNSEDIITKQDQEDVINLIMRYGLFSKDHISELKKKSKMEKKLITFIEQIYNICKEIYNKKLVDQSKLPYKISESKACEVINRCKLIKKIDIIVRSLNYNEKEISLLKFISKNGFYDYEKFKDKIYSENHIINPIFNDMYTQIFGEESPKVKNIKTISKSSNQKNKNKEEEEEMKTGNDINNNESGDKENDKTNNDDNINYNESDKENNKIDNDDNINSNESDKENEKNEDYSSNLPLHIGTSLIIVSTGVCVTDKPGFNTERYIYPNGFISERLFTSIVNPKEKEWYRSLIIDDGRDEPLFRVESKNNPEIYYEGNTPSNPWIALLKAVEKKKRTLGLKSSTTTTISGPKSYGLSEPEVIKLMKHLPNSEKCTKFASYYNIKNNQNKRKPK